MDKYEICCACSKKIRGDSEIWDGVKSYCTRCYWEELVDKAPLSEDYNVTSQNICLDKETYGRDMGDELTKH